MRSQWHIAVYAFLVVVSTSCGPRQTRPSLAPPAAPMQAAPPTPVTAVTPGQAAPAPVPPAIDPAGDWELRWDRTFSGWKPPIFNGRLSLQHEGPQWKGQLSFSESSATFLFESLRVDGDHIELVFQAPDLGKFELSGWIREDRLIGEIRWADIKWTPVGGRRIGARPLHPAAVDHSMPAIGQGAGGDSPELQTLLRHAAAERSSAIVVVKDGKLNVEAYREGYDGTPLVAMSASKSVVSLAIGLLIADRKLSLETNMASLFPEWRDAGPKSKITVRQLLTHTSGLEPYRADLGTETIRDHALRAKLVFTPGSHFQYNNAAVDFLAVVFKQASGVPIDEYIEKRLFRLLDIVGAYWMKDADGVPRGAGELYIRPVDLAKLGQLMLDGGKWRGKRIISREWIERSVGAGQSIDERCGLLWWREGAFSLAITEALLAAWREDGVDDETLRNARTLLGQRYVTYDELGPALAKAVGASGLEKLHSLLRPGGFTALPAWVSDGAVRGFSARGWLGQYLVVFPKTRVVGVRMREPESADYEHTEMGAEHDGYRDFADDVSKLF